MSSILSTNTMPNLPPYDREKSRHLPVSPRILTVKKSEALTSAGNCRKEEGRTEKIRISPNPKGTKRDSPFLLPIFLDLQFYLFLSAWFLGGEWAFSFSKVSVPVTWSPCFIWGGILSTTGATISYVLSSTVMIPLPWWM